jgi:hypothetical protein
MVNTEDVVHAIETVFKRCRQVLLGRIRTELTDKNKQYESIDLDFALEHCVRSWEDIATKWDSRLEALFAMADNDCDGNLSVAEFYTVRPRSRRSCRQQWMISALAPLLKSASAATTAWVDEDGSLGCSCLLGAALLTMEGGACR